MTTTTSNPTSPSPSDPPLTEVVYLYALGSNGGHQLGLSHNNDTNIPEKCIFNVPSLPSSNRVPLQPNETISTIKSGGNHTLLLTNNGRVFAAGSNECNQLGLTAPLEPDTSTSVPVPPISGPSPSTLSNPGFHLLTWTGPSPSLPISHIAATFTASHLIAHSTTLYTFGHGQKGELGLGPDILNASRPTPAFDVRQHEGEDSTIEVLVACMDHVLLLTSEGTIYACGSARKGQLGEKLRSESTRSAGVIWKVSRSDLDIQGSLSFRPTQLVTARDFTIVYGQHPEQHALFGKAVFSLSKTSDVSAEPPSMRSLPKSQGHDQESNIIESSNTPTLHAGWSSLTTHHHPTGTLQGFGTGTRGQLPPPNLPRVKRIAVGSEHSVALLKDGNVVSWGWGEHGNCGVEVDGRGVVGGRWNVLFESRRSEVKVIGVAAGCASSFFWVEEEGEEKK